MQVNRFFKPAQPGDVDPINWGLLYQAKKDKEGKEEEAYNKGLSFKSQIAGIKTLPGKDSELAKSTIKGVDDVFNKYQNNLGDKTARRQMYSELSNLNVPEVAARLNENYNQYNKYNAEKADLIKKNLWKDRYDTIERQIPDEEKNAARVLSPFTPQNDGYPYTKTIKEKVEYNPLDAYNKSDKQTFDYTPEAYVNPIPEVQELYFKPIRDAILKEGKKDYLGNQVITKGVDRNKIDQVVEQNIGNVANTVAGQTLIKDQRELLGDAAKNMSDEDILRSGMRRAGESYIRNDEELRRYNIDEDALRRSRDKEKVVNPLYYNAERTPMENIPGSETIPGMNFGIQTLGKGLEGAASATIGGRTASTLVEPYKGRDLTLLDKPVVQNLVAQLPTNIQTYYNAIKSTNNQLFEFKDKKNTIKDTNPVLWKHMTDAVFNALQETQKGLVQDMKEGSYLHSYYPSKIEGNQPSYTNNVDFQTKYTLGTDKIKELGGGVAANRKYYDPESGKVLEGKEFIETIRKANKSNPDATVNVVGDIDPTSPYAQLTNDSDFAEAKQINVNGKYYVMSGNPDNGYAKNSNATYNKMKRVNRGVEFEEPEDGQLLKQYGLGDHSITKKYDPRTETYQFKIDGKVITSDTNFHNANDTFNNYLKSLISTK